MNSKLVTSSLVRKLELLVQNQAQILLSPLAEASPSPSPGCGRLVSASCSWRQGLTTHQCFSRLTNLVVHKQPELALPAHSRDYFGGEMGRTCAPAACSSLSLQSSFTPSRPSCPLSLVCVKGEQRCADPRFELQCLTKLSVTCLPANC